MNPLPEPQVAMLALANVVLAREALNAGDIEEAQKALDRIEELVRPDSPYGG